MATQPRNKPGLYDQRPNNDPKSYFNIGLN